MEIRYFSVLVGGCITGNPDPGNFSILGSTFSDSSFFSSRDRDAKRRNQPPGSREIQQSLPNTMIIF
jgi:hypothetical protein